VRFLDVDDEAVVAIRGDHVTEGREGVRGQVFDG
jgi:hypothetical protein